MTDLRDDPTQWFPMPAVLITCKPPGEKANLMGIGYVGFTCWQPPTVCLGINTARFSGEIIRETKEFVIALPGPAHVLNMDYCGFISGVDCDKFQAAGFTPVPADLIKAPLVRECPVNLECRLQQVIAVGSHDLFLGRVLKTHVDEQYVNGETPLRPIILLSRKYVAATEFICDFGASAGNPPELSGLQDDPAFMEQRR
jgi:flavin reductase (DIM6/NTAB) family NADH-FMN oxidoreductase RutF